jgi:hypothetical protein
VLDERPEQPPVDRTEREIGINDQPTLRHAVTSVMVFVPFYNVANIVVNAPHKVDVVFTRVGAAQRMITLTAKRERSLRNGSQPEGRRRGGRRIHQNRLKRRQ